LETCTNTSSPPSLEMKPNPRSVSKNFTVPCTAEPTSLFVTERLSIGVTVHG
jgi:hypothetical protein